MRSFAIALLCAITPWQATLAEEPSVLVGQVKAVGIAGASAVAQVGFFHPGGPIHDKPAFAEFTMPGHVLDKDRVHRIDYGNGNEPYKADWMEEKRTLWRLSAFNPRTVRGLIGAARAKASSLAARWRSR